MASKVEKKRPRVIAIVGPTSSGKTSLSIELARILESEIIACDSRTIYRHMDIGTAKPSLEERQGIKHYFLDIVDPDESYSAAQFGKYGGEIIEKLHEENRIPIVCGGTGFYARALLEGLKIPEVSPREDLRKELSELASKNGIESVREMLARLDPVSANKIATNDLFRMIRAIEVSTALGIPFSEAASKSQPAYDVVWIGLNFEERAILKNRIESRLESQLKDGLLQETINLIERFGKTRAILNAVTYKQMVNHIDGLWTMEEAIDDCLRHNYQLARRQLIWFRANKQMNWISVDKCANLLEATIEILKRSQAI